MKIIQLTHRTVDELLEEIFAITSKQKIDTNDRRVLYALACAMKNRYENDVPKWIPVSERLPSKYGNYLVAVKSWDETASIIYYDVDHYGPDWLHDERRKKVVAWIPLPEPYQEGETE